MGGPMSSHQFPRLPVSIFKPDRRCRRKALLAAAGSIVQVEARHAASIAILTGMQITPNGAFDKPLTTKQVLAAAGPLIK